MSYTINISEQQRAILAAAMAAYALPGAPAYNGEEQDEAMVLRDLLVDLPASEKDQNETHGKAPGQTIHGFAL